MTVSFHKNFKKLYKKLSPRTQTKFKNRLQLFLDDEYDPTLNNHALKGRYTGYRSINVTGDIRAIFKRIEENALFVTIGSHSSLYG